MNAWDYHISRNDAFISLKIGVGAAIKQIGVLWNYRNEADAS
jgi:hypothetical protein